jgi:hypothetical protein
MLHTPQSVALLVSACAAIGGLAAGGRAIYQAVAGPAPAGIPATDGDTLKLYLLVGVILYLLKELSTRYIDFRKGILQATAGTDRERADKLQAQLDEMAKRHAAEIMDLSQRHTAEVAEWVKIDARHKGIVAESLARSNELRDQLEKADARNQRLQEQVERLQERRDDHSMQVARNNQELTVTNRILAEKQAPSPVSSDAIPTSLAPPEPVPITIVPGSEPVPVREVDDAGPPADP